MLSHGSHVRTPCWMLACVASLCTAACAQGASPVPLARSAASVIAPTALPAAEPISIGMSGTVVEIGGGPVADATVSVRKCSNDHPPNGDLIAQAQTDATGTFRLTIQGDTQHPVQCVDLIADKGGYQSATAEEYTSHDNIRFRMQRLRRVTGRVVEVDGGPVPAVIVANSGLAGAETFSDANGFFALDEVGRLLALFKTGYVAREVESPQGQDVNLGTVRLQRTIEVSVGATLASRISSADVSYDDFRVMGDEGKYCSPCKWIDLETQQNLDIHLEWSGEIPLTLWAVTRGPYTELKALAKPGESSLTLRVPATTRVLLVGVQSATPGQQASGQPVPFKLSVIVP